MSFLRPPTRDQLALAIVLGGLLVLALGLWQLAAARSPHGPSRLADPPATQSIP